MRLRAAQRVVLHHVNACGVLRHCATYCGMLRLVLCGIATQRMDATMVEVSRPINQH